MTGLPVRVGGTRRALMFSGVRRALGRSAAVWVGGGLLILIVGACVLVPFFWPDGTNAFVTAPFAPPSLAHPFGSDDLGRDVFVRTLVGGRIDSRIAAAVVAVSRTGGTIIGGLRGRQPPSWAKRSWPGSWTASSRSRSWSGAGAGGRRRRPSAQIGPTPGGLTGDASSHIAGARLDVLRPAVPGRGDDNPPARLHRGRRDSRLPHALRSSPAHPAQRGPGHRGLRGRRRDPDPSGGVAFAFLGVGVQPPTPEWGAIMYEGGRAHLDSAWWITVCPGLLLALTGFVLSLLGRRLLRGRRRLDQAIFGGHRPVGERRPAADLREVSFGLKPRRTAWGWSARPAAGKTMACRAATGLLAGSGRHRAGRHGPLQRRRPVAGRPRRASAFRAADRPGPAELAAARWTR